MFKTGNNLFYLFKISVQRAIQSHHTVEYIESVRLNYANKNHKYLLIYIYNL